MMILPSLQLTRFTPMAQTRACGIVGMAWSRSRYGNCAALPAIALLCPGRVRRPYSHPNCPTMLTFVRAFHSRKSRCLAFDVPTLAFSAKKRLHQAELGEGARR